MTSSTATVRRAASFVRASVLCLVMLALLAGCGGVTGVYSHTENDPDGDTMTMSLELKSGGVAVMNIKGGPMSATFEGTYVVEGENVKITIDGDTETFALADGGLKGDFMGDDVVLKKE